MSFSCLKTSKDFFLLNLPALDECSKEQQDSLLIHKLQLCSIIFLFPVEGNSLENEFNESFDIELQETLAKQTKSQYLQEIIDWMFEIETVVLEKFWEKILKMIKINLFGGRVSSTCDDENPSWSHLGLVYELFARFVMKSDRKLIEKAFDEKLILNIIYSFNTKDARERKYLQTILYLIYCKNPKIRKFIRISINNIFLTIIYQNEHNHGTSELLLFMNRVIKKWKAPLKEEHIYFLRNILVPLHKVPTLEDFHEQLNECIMGMIEKNSRLSCIVICGILQFWPVTSSQKEVLFLTELKEILKLMEKKDYKKVIVPLFKRISITMSSDHSHIAQTSMELWANGVVLPYIYKYRRKLYPIILPALQKNLSHWNQPILNFTRQSINALKKMDSELYLRCLENQKLTQCKKKDREARWQKVHALCTSVSA